MTSVKEPDPLRLWGSSSSVGCFFPRSVESAEMEAAAGSSSAASDGESISLARHHLLLTLQHRHHLRQVFVIFIAPRSFTLVSQRLASEFQ